MTIPQQILTIGLCVLGTVLTRFLPFLVSGLTVPRPGIFSILALCCLRGLRDAGGLLSAQCLGHAVQLRTAGADRDYSGDPSAPLEAADDSLHCRRTVCYMLLVQLVF